MEKINDLLIRFGNKKFPELVIKEVVKEVVKRELGILIKDKDINFSRQDINLKINNQEKARLKLLSNKIITELNTRLKNTDFRKIN